MNRSELMGLIRAWSLTMTVAVSIVGVGYAYYLGLMRGYLSILYSSIALAGALLLHISVNVLNDYYDVVYGVDTPESPTARYRQHPILAGSISLSRARALGFAVMSLGVALGLYLFLVEGLWVVIFGLLGIFILYAYTGPPFTLKYRGLGEVAVSLVYGPLLVGGFFASASMGLFSPAALLVSMPPMLIMLAIIYANNYRDRDYDRRAGVVSLAMLTEKYGVGIYAGSLVAAFAITILLALAGITPMTSLIALAVAPMAPGLIRDFRGGAADIDARTGRLYTLFCLLFGIGIIFGRV